MKRDIRAKSRKDAEKSIPNEAELEKKIRLEMVEKLRALLVGHPDSR